MQTARSPKLHFASVSCPWCLAFFQKTPRMTDAQPCFIHLQVSTSLSLGAGPHPNKAQQCHSQRTEGLSVLGNVWGCSSGLWLQSDLICLLREAVGPAQLREAFGPAPCSCRQVDLSFCSPVPPQLLGDSHLSDQKASQLGPFSQPEVPAGPVLMVSWGQRHSLLEAWSPNSCKIFSS